MVKRVVIAGCRDFHDYTEAKKYIDFCISSIRKTYTIIILSGGCRGADLLGERYAKENGMQIERFPAEWNKYGKSAGIIRNRQMAASCDYVICFWDGQSRGTKSMINLALEMNKPIKIKQIKNAANA